jgi:hypothetical protein
VSELDELDAEDEQDLSPVACETHGDVEIVDEHCVSGFTGAPIYFVDLSCGCQLVDASADNLGAAE